MKTRLALVSIVAIAGLASAASGSVISSVNGVNVVPYLFGDRPDSELTITNNFPATLGIRETGFGAGGFANRHAAYLSTNGGTSPVDFNYADGFDITMTVNYTERTQVEVEAGFQTDLFGYGYFGQLPNGEIAAFGSILPFHSFGVLPVANSVSLRMIHSPGSGDGINPLPSGGVPSTFEYLYSLDGGTTWVSSGLKPMGGTEGGIPSSFPFYVGFGSQHNRATETGAVADLTFKNFTLAVPTPGSAALLGLAGLVGLRRRR